MTLEFSRVLEIVKLHVEFMHIFIKLSAAGVIVIAEKQRNKFSDDATNNAVVAT